MELAACQAFWVPPVAPAEPAAPTATYKAAARARPRVTATASATLTPAPTETPANRLDLLANQVQYWSNANSIHDLVFDGTSVWAATFGGLVQWTLSGSYTIHGLQQGMPSQAVRALAVDAQHRLWVSYADVDGYSVRVGEAWQHYATRREAISAEYASLQNASRMHPAMFVCRPGSTWIWEPRLDGRVEAYDGSRWRIYGPDNGVTPQSDRVGISPDGRVWAVGEGIAYAQEGELYWQDHTFFSEIEQPDDVTDIAVDKVGTLWLAFAGAERGGLVRFDPAEQRWEGHLPEMNPAIPAGSQTLQIDDDGTLWVGGTDKLSYQYPQRRFRSYELPGITVHSFAPGSQGEIWLGSNNGLWRLDAETGQAEGPWLVPSPLPDNRITALTLDGQGTLYVATPRGVSLISHSGETALATDEPVSWLGTDAAGQVWAAGRDGIGVLSPDGLGPTIYPMPDIVTAALGSSGNVYMLTRDGKLTIHDGQAARELADLQAWTGAPGRAVALDTAGGLWVATGSGLAHLAPDGTQTIYNKDNGLLSDDVRGLALDGEGNLWAATAAGLARHRPDGRWTRFTVESTGGGLRDMDMRDVSLGPVGDLWMATRAGISRREPVEADWSYVDLPGAQRVLYDGESHLWVSTGAGLYRVPTGVLTAIPESQ